MTEKEIKTLAELLNYTYSYPIYLYKNEDLLLNYSYLGDVSYELKDNFFNSNISPNYTITKLSKAHYGYVKIDNFYSLIIGPIFPVNSADENIRYLSVETGIKYCETFKNNAKLMPKLSYHVFLKVLAFVNYIFTGKQIDLLEHFTFLENNIDDKIDNIIINNDSDYKNDNSIHGTYFFEQQLIDFVKQGDVNNLKKFIINSTKSSKMVEGNVAEDPIRQAKNIFNGLVNVIGKFAAIPAGLDIEETYKIIDTYIRLCEKTNDLEKIKIIQFNMLIDFTNRIHNSKITSKVSKDVALIMDFINVHIQEKLTINKIAEGVNSSKTTITSKFKEETGLTINEYIMDKKIEIAKNMLKHTTHSILYISDFLSFSSQAYFQNCFKKYVHTTPLEYRKIKQQNINEKYLN